MRFLWQTSNFPDSSTESESFMDIIFNSGVMGILIFVILLILSVVAVYIFFERYATITRASKVDENFMNNIRTNVMAGNIEAAKATAHSQDTPVARMVEKGLMRIGRPLRDIEASIENVGNLELFKLERNLSTLASIAGIAPMIGFFGTVTGMILSFREMATQQNVTPDVLAGGIYQALLTTAMGLVVGIIALFGYNYLVSMVDSVVFKMERYTTDFMDILQEPSN